MQIKNDKKINMMKLGTAIVN